MKNLNYNKLILSTLCLHIMGCSTAIYSVKSNLPKPDDVSGVSHWSYNTGFKRSIIVSQSTKDGSFSVATSDVGDQTYNVYYDKNPFFSDTFDLKLDANGRLDTNDLKTSSDVGSIISSMTSLARAAAGAAGVIGAPLPGPPGGVAAPCVSSPATASFPSTGFELCKGYEGRHQPITVQGNGYKIDVDCTGIVQQATAPNSEKGLLVYEAKPVRVTVIQSIKWTQTDTSTGKTTSCAGDGYYAQEVAYLDVVYPNNLHSIPVNRNAFTSPETLISTKGGFLSEYKLTATGGIKGFFDIITSPLKSLLPTVSVNNGKASSTYSSQ